MRVLTEPEFCHERLGEQFDRALSEYDTQCRVDVLVDQFLVPRLVPGAEVLDVGCGLGFFSERLQAAGARVTASDIGPGLLDRTRTRVGCECVQADALSLTEHFGKNRFDFVLSSECIEHTPDPRLALRQMASVLRPGGWLAVSTPNVLWYPAVALASWLRIRPFDGYENFLSWRSMRETLRNAGLRIEREMGLHLFPFQFGMHRLSRWCDRRLQRLRGAMINVCVLAHKPSV